jgi:hypothetical protein
MAQPPPASTPAGNSSSSSSSTQFNVLFGGLPAYYATNSPIPVQIAAQNTSATNPPPGAIPILFTPQPVQVRTDPKPNSNGAAKKLKSPSKGTDTANVSMIPAISLISPQLQLIGGGDFSSLLSPAPFGSGDNSLFSLLESPNPVFDTNTGSMISSLPNGMRLLSPQTSLMNSNSPFPVRRAFPTTRQGQDGNLSQLAFKNIRRQRKNQNPDNSSEDGKDNIGNSAIKQSNVPNSSNVKLDMLSDDESSENSSQHPDESDLISPVIPLFDDQVQFNFSSRKNDFDHLLATPIPINFSIAAIYQPSNLSNNTHNFESNLDLSDQSEDKKKRQKPSSDPAPQRKRKPVSKSKIKSSKSKVLSEHEDNEQDFKFLTDPLSSENAEDDRIYAQVACMPCFKAKIRCNDERPCSNCIKRNRSGSCVDRSHKPRGRPKKIKPEDENPE